MTNSRKIELGSRDANFGDWMPYTWVEPGLDTQVKGEFAIIRTGSTSGAHQAGLWRSGAGVPGCDDGGSCVFDCSAQDADEVCFVIEGEATVTVGSTNAQFKLRPGSIFIQPKGLAVRWATHGPSFKKLWVHWDSPRTNAASNVLFVGHVDDDSEAWVPYEWVEPQNGLKYSCGELLVLSDTGSSGTLRCGVWRSRLDESAPPAADIAACKSGRCAGHRIGSARGIGDETMILLEGASQIVDEDTSEAYHFVVGDIIAVYEGLQGRWTSKSPYMKKFWVVTNANLPET